MKKVLFAFCFLFMVKAYAADDRIIANAHLTSVTVYRSGAEMVHTVSAVLKAGNNELIIRQVSNQLDENSIQVKVGEAITILGTSFGSDFTVTPTKSPRIKAIEDSLESLHKQLTKLDLAITNTNELLQVLHANKDIKGTQTGLSVAELIKLMDYYKLKGTELQTELSQQNEKKEALKIIESKMQAQLNEEQSKNTATDGNITLQVIAAEAGKYNFEISYIATNASWIPFYDIRIDDIKNPMKLLYKAQINQTTGIDWKQIKLSLSTATPGQTGQAPELSTWFLSYVYPQRRLMSKMAVPQAAMGMQMNAINDEVGVKAYGAEKKKTLKVFEEYVDVKDNMLNVMFDIDIPYDVPTNGKEQTAVLKTYQVPASFKHLSIPKLDKDAYILAQVQDWEKLNLLPGRANVIFEGTYTGTTTIDPNATQDTLSLTIGKDKRVVVKRDKLVDYSSVKFLGSNKLQRFSYEITVKNNKKEAINLLLKDQFPISTTKEIEVELVDSNGATVNNDLGTLNWQLNIPSNESKKVKFTYTVKYPKDKVVNVNQ